MEAAGNYRKAQDTSSVSRFYRLQEAIAKNVVQASEIEWRREPFTKTIPKADKSFTFFCT